MTTRDQMLEQWVVDHPEAAEKLLDRLDREAAERKPISPGKAALLEKDRAAAAVDGRRGNPNRIA